MTDTTRVRRAGGMTMGCDALGMLAIPATIFAILAGLALLTWASR